MMVSMATQEQREGTYNCEMVIGDGGGGLVVEGGRRGQVSDGGLEESEIEQDRRF